MIIWRGGWRSQFLVAERFVCWLTPALRAGLVGFPKSDEVQQLPIVGRHRVVYGLNMFKFGPLAFCWY